MNKNTKDKNKEEQKETIVEKRILNLTYISLAILIAIIFFLAVGGAMLIFSLTLIPSLILATLAIVIYAIILFFLLEPRILRVIEKTRTEQIEKPILKTIEKPVIKKVFVTKPAKISAMKRYSYVASKNTGVVHKTSCRSARMIKYKHRVFGNNLKAFEERGFRPDKICILGKKLQDFRKQKKKTKK